MAGVRYEPGRDGVARVTLDRPEALNALDSAAKPELASIWGQASADPAVRSVILCGAGSKAFCAGSDMKEMARTGRSVPTDLLLRALPGAAEPFDKPVVAALHGFCVGMGLTLALHCDLRLAARDTVRGFPEVRHGMISAVSAARSFGATDGQLFATVSLPAAVPFIITGLRLGVGNGLIGVVVGELYAANAGIGFLIAVGGQTLQMPKAFVGIVVIAAAGVVLMALLQGIERRFQSWRPDR